MAPANKQDIQNIVNTSQNRIIEKMVPRQDVQWLIDNMRSMLTLAQQNQQFLRQAEFQRLQLIRRVAALETRSAQLEQLVRASSGTLTKVAAQQAQSPKVVFAPHPRGQTPNSDYSG